MYSSSEIFIIIMINAYTDTFCMHGTVTGTAIALHRITSNQTMFLSRSTATLALMMHTRLILFIFHFFRRLLSDDMKRYLIVFCMVFERFPWKICAEQWFPHLYEKRNQLNSQPPTKKWKKAKWELKKVFFLIFAKALMNSWLLMSSHWKKKNNKIHHYQHILCYDVSMWYT